MKAMRKKEIIQYSLPILIYFVLLFQLDARPFRVLFVNPNENPAFNDFGKAFRAASEDLGVEADEYLANEWPDTMIKDIRLILNSHKRPDYLIITVHKGAGIKIIQLAENEKIPVFTINSGLIPQDSAKYGLPREKFKYWIGQILPDDDGAGFNLANILIDHAKAKGKRDVYGKVNIFGFGGNPTDQAAIERNNGLLRAVSNRSDVTLLQLVKANWTTEMANEKAPLVFKRYSNINAFWCANDSMALGVLPIIRQLPIASQPYIASMDWLPEILIAIRKGEIIASFGGHFLDAAWALILIHDYHFGIDFKTEGIDLRTKLYPITKGNVDEFSFYFGDHDWNKIDFSKFSKVKNKSLSRYDFSFASVLNQQRLQRGKQGNDTK